MCGIAGILNLSAEPIPRLSEQLHVCNSLQKHRGPDDDNIWKHKNESLGFGHTRLSIIDISNGSQPMCEPNGNCIVFNGEIYNFLELKAEIGKRVFKTQSDTETILKAYERWGYDCLDHFRGMFSFALWDEKEKTLFCARDFFGIKPFYYTVVDNKFYFASEIKALLPFVKDIETDLEAFKEYLSFQFVLKEKTLFKNIHQLLPGHFLTIKDGDIRVKKYWEVYYNLDFEHTEKYFQNKLQGLLEDSLRLHTRSDVPIGGYLSGGLDSSIICSLASRAKDKDFMAFTGKFSEGEGYDESHYAKIVALQKQFELSVYDIKSEDFIENIRKVIYHLDYPTAGPGSFSQYMISKHASQYRKVLLGGQGGDEIFGGYARYLIAYFEQCIKAAVDGTLKSGNFIVTYESIIPNLKSLKNYKPLLERFWSKGLFEEMDKRYFSLVDRTPLLSNEINWEALSEYSPYDTFKDIFYGKNVGKKSYFDLMTHFDFKTLLPALLQVEDRVSMAHGIESRVPLLDRPYVEFAATIPSNIKFKNGNMKNIFKKSIKKYVPREITNRKDKMGFPTPFSAWSKKELKEFIMDTLTCKSAQERNLVNNKEVVEKISSETEFGRSLWGFLSLEIWQQEFHDKASEYRKRIVV
jgi:asparagine synthase (glutamine-hydrolysing)